MFRTSVKSKTIMTFGTMAIAAVMFFAAGSVTGNQKALAANLAGSGLADPDQVLQVDNLDRNGTISSRICRWCILINSRCARSVTSVTHNQTYSSID
jgi:hypothetical protein